MAQVSHPVQYNIREGTKEDCYGILQLVKELAEYEHSLEQVKIDEQVLIQDGFGKHPYFHTLVAEVTTPGEADGHKHIAGFMLFFNTYSTWEGRMIYLEDFYVSQSYRDLGIGSALWHRINKIAYDENCCRIHFSVLNWNTIALEFYNKRGAVNISERDGWQVYRVDRSTIEQTVNKIFFKDQ